MLWTLVDVLAVVAAFAVVVVLGPGVMLGPWRHLRKRLSQSDGNPRRET